MVTRLAVGVVLLLTPLAAAAAPDCATVLERCHETPRRCRAAALKRCVRQGIAACAMVTTTMLPPAQAAHCTRCPTATCEADGVTCEGCPIPPHVTILPGPCDPPNHHPCCDTPPQPVECSTCGVGIDPASCRALWCQAFGPAHGCCAQP